MNKRIFSNVLIPVMALLFLCTTSCPGFSVFMKVPELTFETGATKGTIRYSWKDIDAEKNMQYMLFVLQGWHDADEVIANGNTEASSIGTQSGTFTGEAGEWYSAVVMADSGSDIAYSKVKQAKAKVTEEGEYDLRFGIISDIHVTRKLPISAKRFERVLDWYNTEDINALAIVGDITDYGTQDDWDDFKYSWEKHKGKLQLIAVMGNHDVFGGTVPYDESTENKNICADRFEMATGQNINAHYIINGYHFIVLSPGTGAFIDQGERGGAIASGRTETPGSLDNGNNVSLYTVQWAREQIDIAKANSPSMPIFVFCHWPIPGTIYNLRAASCTTSFGSNPSNGFFMDDPEVIFFSGHVHRPNSDPRAMWQGAFTTVNTAPLFYINLEEGYLGNSEDGIVNSRYPKIAGYPGTAGQGMIVSIKNSRVIIDNYDFDLSDGLQPIGATVKIPQQTWEFDVSRPMDFPYTNVRRNAQKSIPVFDDAKPTNASLARIVLKTVTDTSVEVEFPQAWIPLPNLNNEVVHSYRFDFINQQTGIVTHSAKQWSDFMLTPRQQKPTYTQLIGGLTPDTAYELRIYAYGSFQECSTQYLACVFKTSDVVLIDI